jgi:tRNA pseudouridine38-40 synthase
MPRYFLNLSYNGRNYNGWQVQKNTPNTVQAVLETKLEMILREKVATTGCGRTDTGVNARNYICHFDSEALSGKPFDFWIYKLNTVLPDDISVEEIIPVTTSAHARFDAESRAYYYYIGLRKDPFKGAFNWFLHEQPDFELMNEAGKILLRHTDFGCFSKSNTQNKTNICTVESARWLRSGTYEWRFHIQADRFLRGMVRAVVGTMVLVGKKKISLTEFEEIVLSRDRKNAGANAPAHALFFTGAKYPASIYM